jgi:hypothetical protein
MTLTDPREALAEQSNFVSYLTGLASLGQVVHALADGDRRADPPAEADDFVHVLLGVAHLGEAVESLAEPAPTARRDASPAPAPNVRWLR